jgi:transcriptional regulator with XRE-family HTH domain
MITAPQLRAARVLLGMDQRQLAELAGLSVPTIQRMEASEAMVRGNVDSLVKLITALDAAGVEMIDEGAVSNSQGRGVRLKINSGSAKSYLNNQIESKASSGTRARTYCRPSSCKCCVLRGCWDWQFWR